MTRSVSISSAQECPSEELLRKFDLGKLPEAACERVADHVAGCDACEEILAGLQGQGDDDSLVNDLRICLEKPDLAFGPAFERIDGLAGTLSMGSGRRGGRIRAGDTDLWVDDFADDLIGPYLVGKRIGRGGMGVVYKARHARLGWSVALKLILAGRGATPSAVDRFLREGRMLAKLDRHPNIVQVLDSGESDGLPYYAMELLTGLDLRKKLEPMGGRLAPREAAEVVRTLALAVESMHRQDVIHRDLKTANVMVLTDGTLKIVDFGLAKLVAVDSGALETAAISMNDEILGTPSYMSPEQAGFGTGAVTKSTDIYSLGAILYELLTGQPPFKAATKQQTLHLVGTMKPIPPSRERPEVHRWLEAICLKCLEKQPEGRYPSARALADDLQRWLEGEVPDAVGTRWERLVRATRRRARPVGISVGVAIAALPILPLLSTTPRRDKTTAESSLNNPIRDSSRVLAEIQTNLKHGFPAVLIGETGDPKWSRWLRGKPTRLPGLAPDRTFTLETWSTNVLQLLPDTELDHFKLTAQVRHEKSELDGSVGIFVGQSTYSLETTNIHFFTQLAFNVVRGQRDRTEMLPPEIQALRKDVDSPVRLTLHAIEDPLRMPTIDARFLNLPGPRFRALGEGNGVWQDLEMIVTPTNVTARWNGSPPFTLEVGKAQRHVDEAAPLALARKNQPNQRIPALKVSNRGGVGLFLSKGEASFRNVVVTPL